ncbi:hypothetical protein LZC95_21945 [Pendulispora brunnea]|uniref:Cytochrome c domain-containing protein n=1 Tax=Pendulispora brunnea TaxID=2905690 RepID=A0ABZ2KN47_9BACT
MRYGSLFNRATIAGLASIAAWLAVTASCKSNSGDPAITEDEDAGGGGTGPQSYFDYPTFQTKIQPALDNAETTGCTASACHGADEGAGGFKLYKGPAAGSAEELANFTAMTDFSSPDKKVDLDTPNNSEVYKRANPATDKHGNGKSKKFSEESTGDLLQWIQAAKAAKDAQNQPPTQPGDGGIPQGNGCVDPSEFNLGTFQADILPILTGQKDYNVNDQVGNGNGCAGSTCHGQDKPGALTIKKNASAADNLRSFACYVNKQNPVQSQIVVCPLGKNNCKKSPHPGSTVFRNPGDLNYQRIMSFLYATKTATTPLDFAFFSRQVAPIFENTQVTGGRPCSDTTACHGVGEQTQAPPNGSHFPMITGAIDKARLGFSFNAASNFTSFLNARDSYLFLYPTNEIARNPAVDQGASKFAKGVAHTGGKLIDPSSFEAQQILTWAQGLRLVGNGFNLNWLVAGDYAGTNNINQETPAGPEKTTNPAIFDKMGSNTFQNGIWDGLFENRTFINFNERFPRAVAIDRAAFAVAYIVNLSGTDINARITVQSPNEIKVYVDQDEKAVKDAQQDSTQTSAILTAPRADKKSTRIMVKALQRQGGSNQFGFALNITDQNGNAIPVEDIVIKLSPDGGI